MTRGESSPFMTSSPRKTKLPPPRHPLENRNSAPDIVVTGTTGLTQFRHSSLGNCPTSGPAINPTGSRRQQHPLEDRIHRAKARVQNGLYNLSSTSQSSSASSIYSTNRYLNFKLPCFFLFALQSAVSSYSGQNSFMRDLTTHKYLAIFLLRTLLLFPVNNFIEKFN